jgi:putative ABC transport system ATP-binding protein
MTDLHIQDLTFVYRASDFVLHVPKLSVDARAAVAFIGASGSGKTTLLHLIAGIARPQRGRILVGGDDVTALGAAARRAYRIRRIGLIFQSFELLEHLSVLDNILLPYRIAPSLVLDGGVRDRAARLADRVGLGDKLRRGLTRLSQGERQRVAICRALVPQPALLLADEPTGNLDPSSKGRVLEILFEQAQENAATLVTVTHDHDLLDRFDRVVDFKTFHGAGSPA